MNRLPEYLQVPVRKVVLLDRVGSEGGGGLLQWCSTNVTLTGLVHLGPLG